MSLEGDDISGLPPHKIAALGLVHVPGGRSVFPDAQRRRQPPDGRVALPPRPRAVREQTERVLDLFPSLRERLDEPAAGLSGGQQQMLTVAMSLLVEPKMLMIDELSLGLSPLVVEQLLGVVRQLHDEGVTVIVVEQSVNTALRAADRAYFLEKGTIRFHGLTADLLDRPDLLRSIFLEGWRGDGHRAPATAPTRDAEVDAAADDTSTGPWCSRWRESRSVRGRDGARRRLDRAARGRDPRVDRTERRGQDDAVRRGLGLPRAEPAAGSCSAASTSPVSARSNGRGSAWRGRSRTHGSSAR